MDFVPIVFTTSGGMGGQFQRRYWNPHWIRVAEEGGPQLIETLPNASSMPPSNAAAESGAADARDEEEDDEADGAADGTQRNDAKGGLNRSAS